MCFVDVWFAKHIFLCEEKNMEIYGIKKLVDSIVEGMRFLFSNCGFVLPSI